LTRNIAFDVTVFTPAGLTLFLQAALADRPHHRARACLWEGGPPAYVPDAQPTAAMGIARRRSGGEMRMTAMDLLGLMLIVFLVAPMLTARPSRF
jgi:hypothetical protein